MQAISLLVSSYAHCLDSAGQNCTAEEYILGLGLTTEYILEYILGWCSPEEVDLGKAVFGKKIILCLH